MYFKDLFSVLDLILLRSKGKTPKDHTERFRMLEKSNSDLHGIMDKYFRIYRDTYSISIDKETCDEVRKTVKRVTKEYEIGI